MTYNTTTPATPSDQEQRTASYSTEGASATRTNYPPADGRLPAPASSGGTVERTTLALGRLLFGGYFVYNGINHFQNAETMAGYAGSKGVPAAGLAVQASGAMILLGGLSLITGYRPKLGAGLITAFLAGVTPVMHAFWKSQDDQERMSEMVNFTKNVALIGGAALAAAIPEPWPATPAGASARGHSQPW